MCCMYIKVKINSVELQLALRILYLLIIHQYTNPKGVLLVKSIESPCANGTYGGVRDWGNFFNFLSGKQMFCLIKV